MVRTLIVEDDTGKLQRIIQALISVEGFEIDSITHAVDASTAKRHLQETSFDLCILDIAIPSRMDREAESEGGIRLLDEIIERDEYKKPTHIIGMTGYPDLLRTAESRFSQRLLTVVLYDPISNDWVDPLKSRVRHIIQAKDSDRSVEIDYSSFVFVVCALESPELRNVLQIGWGWEQIHVESDHTIYYRGQFEKGGERQVVYAAHAARMGMTASAILATKAMMLFKPRYLAMAGITAGVPGRTRMGDIIAADPSWDWGSGKWTVEDGELKFMSAPNQLPLNPTIRNKLRLLAADTATFATIRESWPGDPPDHPLTLHVGPLASGASVLADGQTAQRIKQQHRELLGVEMETYGIYAAAEEAPVPRPEVFSLKSVVDFADIVKDDRYQKYAAYTSAQALRFFIERYL